MPQSSVSRLIVRYTNTRQSARKRHGLGGDLHQFILTSAHNRHRSLSSKQPLTEGTPAIPGQVTEPRAGGTQFLRSISPYLIFPALKVLSSEK